jgi:hypothetical protein
MSAAADTSRRLNETTRWIRLIERVCATRDAVSRSDWEALAKALSLSLNADDGGEPETERTLFGPSCLSADAAAELVAARAELRYQTAMAALVDGIVSGAPTLMTTSDGSTTLDLSSIDAAHESLDAALATAAEASRAAAGAAAGGTAVSPYDEDAAWRELFALAQTVHEVRAAVRSEALAAGGLHGPGGPQGGFGLHGMGIMLPTPRLQRALVFMMHLAHRSGCVSSASLVRCLRSTTRAMSQIRVSS